MGCNKTDAVEEDKTYYFSPALGFQQDNKPIWYEMDGEPIVIKNDDKSITIESVFWKDYEVILKLLFENYPLIEGEDHSQILDFIKIYSPDQQRTMNGNSYSSSENDLGELYGAIITFNYREVSKEIAFDLFGEKHIVSIKPIQAYDSLDDIGIVQTHNGRSIIINDDETNRIVYTYSNDIWKIFDLINMREIWNFFSADESSGKASYPTYFKWNKAQSLENTFMFQCIDETIDDTNSFDISGVCLRARCEDLLIPITLNEGKQAVDIPFSIGNDQYSIYEIEVKPGTYGNNEDAEVCTDIYIRVKNVEVEEGTKLYSLDATLGVEEEVLGYSYDPATGKSETKVYGTHVNTIGFSYKLWGDDQFQESFDEMEPVICIKIDQSKELPEKVVLKIESASKSWDQPFQFEMD